MTSNPNPKTLSAAQIRDLIVGRSPALLAALDRLEEIAAQPWPVLITGESGTGKELAVQLVHAASQRRGPLIEVCCGEMALRPIHSELFGHRKGAFSGAIEDHIGLFEQANGGTLLLDEVSDMPWAMQTALLRVLETGIVRRVGDSSTRTVDVRVISTTHQDLNACVEARTFHLGLFKRLALASVHLPALRERGADILLLAKHLLAEQGLERELSIGSTKAAFEATPWPGNIWQLRRTLCMAALETDSIIKPKHLQLLLC